mgnify:CR=1 FL=1|tara:strand:- start:6451 stop:7368 length:918 start_codon:yes stop_codon:yes gene_type:complete
MELKPTTEQYYKSIKPNFVQLTDEKNFKKEVGFAIQIIKKSSYLQKCSQESILQAVFNISQTNLTLNPVLKYAYLIPRKGVCVLEPGYQGLIKLATDTDNINSIDVQLVYEGDEVEIDLASEEKVLKHRPYLVTGEEQGKIIFGYSKATLQDGSKHVEIMSIKQIHDVMECSESYKYSKSKSYTNSPWFTNKAEMCRKTIVKRHFKYLPKSENKHLEKAIELDNEDYDFPMTYEQGSYIESLLFNAAIEGKAERQITSAMHANSMTNKQAADCIQFLLDNQVDPVMSGNQHYSQGDIQKTLEKTN